jgi:putative aldouronate transport system substrate-binding protein
MGRKRWIAFLLCMCMVFTMLTGCKKETETNNPDGDGGKAATEQGGETTPKAADPTEAPVELVDPFGKMDPEIEQTGIRIKTSWMTLDEGEDENNNVWSRAMKDILGITLTQKWTASDWGAPFDEKVNLAISTDDMPDIAGIYTTLFFRAVDNERVSDLTEAYEKYASPALRSYMEMNDGAALKTVTYDGKIMGLAAPPSNDDRTFLWIRQDWLDKLQLKAPTTLDELYKLAEDFTTMDPNGNGKADEIGLVLTKNFWGGATDISRLFNAYGLYPNHWVEKDGQLTRGELVPENKELLKKLAELYKKGVIAKDFAIKDPFVECEEDISSGKVGICFGPVDNAGAPALKAAHENTGAVWTAYDLPTTTGELVKMGSDTRVGNFVVAGNKNKHPEAVVKMINLQLEIENQNPEYVKDNTFNMSPNGSMNFWCKPGSFDIPNKTSTTVKKVHAAIQNEAEVANLNLSEKEIYDKFKDYAANQTLDNYPTYAAYREGGSAEKYLTPEYQAAVYLDPAWWPETPAWVQYGQELYTAVQEYFINAVVSGDVDGEFDKWTEHFNTFGGNDILTEYNAKFQEYK